MSTNFISKGEVINYSNTGSAIAAGDWVLLVDRVGVALEAIAATSGTGQVAVEGVYSMAKENPLVINQGDNVYLDTTSGDVNKTSAGRILAGYAYADGASSATVLNVKING